MLVTQLITLAAMGGLGAFYWRIQRRGRLALREERSDRPADLRLAPDAE
jgi:hypothetical protein